MLDDLQATHGARVDFRGPRAGMEGAWEELGLLAVTSRAEGLPLAVLEAMAHGRPVAAFAVGGLPELIVDGVNGYLVPAGDLGGLAERIACWRALTAAGRAAMAAAARHTIAAGFSREAGVAATRAIYRLPD